MASVDEGPRASRPARRSFTVEYKRAIVAEYDAAPVGQKGAVLRRERLYDSHVQEWRAHIEAGTLGASRRGPRPGSSARTAEQAEIAQLRTASSMMPGRAGNAAGKPPTRPG